MPDTPSPGEIAYDAFMAALALAHPTPWHRQDARHHAAWEAAACAARQDWPDVGMFRRMRDALTLAVRYGQIDGAHHKAWVIDQICRTLLGSEDAYRHFVADACAGDEGPDTYGWDEGIAP